MSTIIFSYTDLQSQDNHKYDVILSAYMNSGSRFTGRLLGFNSQTFYFYEPLWKFSTWNYFIPHETMCSSTDGGCSTISTREINAYRPDRYLNDTEPIVENIPANVSPTDLFLHVLSNVYACALLPLHHVIQDRVHDNPIYSGPSWDVYRQCLSRYQARSQCIRDLEFVCRKKSHRFIKVLRLSVGSFRPLLEAHPRLKVLHLVRDPRAIVNSRHFTRNYPVYGYQDSNTMERNLCNKMAIDHREGLKLMADFPERVKFLYYEDVLANLDSRVQQVFQFLKMRYNVSEVRDLLNINVNQSPSEKGNDFVDDRKNDNSNWWRRHIQMYQMKHVDSACAEVYTRYGYKMAKEESSLRNVSYSLLSIPKELVF